MKSRNLLQGLSCRIGQLALLALAAAAPLAGKAATIWNGPLISFTKANGANPTLAANQDRLTPQDWLTRGNSQGLYNASTEGGFSHFLSPADTMWADGTLANYSTLSYHDWNTWAKGIHGGPSATVGVPAVVHLLTADIYLSIDFTSWTSGGAGGGFSYLRSTPSVVPEPAAGLLLLGGLAAAAGVRVSRRRNIEVAGSR
jgi:hypothetical protein